MKFRILPCRFAWAMGFRAVLAIALWSLVVGSLALAEVRNPHGVAVIIGNKHYPHRGVPDVDYADRDAEAFKRYVIDVMGFDPTKIISLKNAKRREMLNVFGSRDAPMSDILAKLDPKGRSAVVVYYSGHGVPGLKDGMGYLLPVDVPPREARNEGYPLELLYKRLDELSKADRRRRAKSVQVFLDACFTGNSYGGFLIQGASPVIIAAALPEAIAEQVTVLTAAGSKQLANWDEQAQHGLFTHHLLDALYGKGDADGDGRVTAVEAKQYLDDYMTPAAWLARRTEQTANLLAGTPKVVLSAAAGEGFPKRPVLGGEVRREEREVVSRSPTPTDHAGVEKGLGLDRGAKVLVQRGLSSLRFDAGPADGLFVGKTRAAVGAWQKAKGLRETGYLTREQADTLMAAGRAERERVDDAAFARAKSSGTVASYEAYLSSHPGGRHAGEARILSAKAKERERIAVGRVFRDCEECPELVVIPAGSFMMGSPSQEEGRLDREGPVHRVRIPKPLAVGKYEVTFEEWDACVSSGGCGGHRPSDMGWGRGDRPVIKVSWEDARAYVAWLSRKTGKRYRLLSESEWEYAARAGTMGPFHFGETISTNEANYDGNYTYGRGRKGRYRKETTPVGIFAVNGFGLHDVHGNVWEWVEDCWNGENGDYEGAPNDGSAWDTGNCGERVLRGGSWGLEPRILRSAFRSWLPAFIRSHYSGFRILRTLTP